MMRRDSMNRGNMDQNTMRLNQYIAACGICSRREADRLIEQGHILVNGVPAVQGVKVNGSEEVRLDGRVITPRREPTVVAFYKPVGVTCTASDPHAQRTLSDVFHYPIRLTYAGRLDRDSEGLLLMTDDGKLIDAMMRGSAGHEKEYIVRVRHKISDSELNTLRKGIWLRDLGQKTRPCRIERLGEYTFRIVLTQGLNRQIRRMCAAVGHDDIKFLKRVRVLNVRLEGLRPGQQRIITGKEKGELYRQAGLKE